MKIAQLRDVLDKFADLYADSGAKSKGKAVASLAAALAQHDKKTVKAFVKSTRERRAKQL